MSPLLYCPICGHALGEREEGGRIRQACDNCGYVHYVNPVPAVGILIEMDGGLVLIRRGNPPHQGEWTLPSGFIEADESAEEAAAREAEEETGLKVEILELFGVNSFPEGPPISGIMVFFRARPTGGTLAAGDDAAEARVFPSDELPVLPFRTHREAAAQWLARQEGSSGQPNEAHTPTSGRGFIIRPAELGEANEVLALLALIPANRELSRDTWREVAQRFREPAGMEVFVAVSEHPQTMVIGFVAVSAVRTLTGGYGLISDMAVLPTYQRRGVGAALLEAAMRRAQRLNLRSLLVATDRANERARAFYASLGFAVEEGIMRLRLR
ncbi:MAG TPA: GNAT family N-acetyltransferase [Candidatus Limnocylindrales bacterium]|nr:GNAT family N-acetyltransferase [Candidatus Limnocylindrales bacterium]